MKKMLLGFLLLAHWSWGQNQWHGTVTDPSGDALAFVNILMNGDPRRGVTTDIDGQFSLPANPDIDFLRFSYLGYQPLHLSLKERSPGKALQIRMHPRSLELEEAVVVAGENPAHRIIRKAVEFREKNNPENLRSFSCATYNKFVFNLLPNREAYQDQTAGKDQATRLEEKRDSHLQKLMDQSENFHLLVWETITEKKFLRPAHRNEKVLYNRLSGLKRPEFVTLAQDLQPFSFYGDYLKLLDKAFLNPISPGSTKKYFFELQDTLYQGVDSVFIISYKPRRGKHFEALEGVLYIHTRHWALQNVIARPAERTMIDMVFEQRYTWVEKGQQWFPEQLNFEVTLPKYPHKYMGLRIRGKTYVKDAVINPPLNKKEFDNLVYTLGDDVFNRSDSVWNRLRSEPLRPKELRTYERLDSVGEKINLDQKLALLTALATGKYPMGKIDLDLARLWRTNYYEGHRFGLGLSTSKRLSENFTASVYGAYGLRDQSWKYGADLTLHLVKSARIDLLLAYANDLREPGIVSFGELSRGLVGRQFYANRMDLLERWEVGLKAPLFKYAQMRLSLKSDWLRPDYPYTFQSGSSEPLSSFGFTSLKASIRYSFGEQFIPLLGLRIPSGNNPHPVFQLSYERGLSGWLNGQFDFDKWLFGVEHQFRIRGLGECTFRLESGWVDPQLPFPMLFSVSGTGGGFDWFAIDYSFQTMDRYEFLSDRFVHLFFRQGLGPFIYQSKFSRPEISLVQNIGLGRLDQSGPGGSPHQDIAFKTMEKGYFESGLVIDNLFRLPYVNVAYIGVGLGFYYRYGPYSLPDFRDNTAFRLTLDFRL